MKHPAAADDPPAGLQEITAVVVTFNSAHCVARLGRQFAHWPHLIVVDNGSDDGTVGAVRHALPQASVLELDENRGFGAANNMALQRITTPYAFLVNPDCEVAEQQAVALLESLLQWPNAAMVVPQLVNRHGAMQLNYGWVRHEWTSLGPAATGVACVVNACGAAMLLRLAALPTREWFDTRFFLYYEDEDLCLRLFQAHKPVLIAPSIHMVHANRGSVRGPHPLRIEWGRGYHHARSKILFAAKHRGSVFAERLRRRALLAAAGLLLLRVLVPSPKHAARACGRLAGLWRAPTVY